MEKAFSPASGTFSTQGLNMEWTTSIQAITEERARQATNLIEEGEMCGKLPEKSTGEKIWDGIVDGTGQAVSDTIDGIKALGDWETWENMGNAALHPLIPSVMMYNVLSDSFINDVINGDAESRAKWGSYALTQVGLGLIGDKGLSKASKLGQAGKVTKLAKNKIPPAVSHITSNLQMEIALLLQVWVHSKMNCLKLKICLYMQVEKSKGLNDNINQAFEVKKIEGKILMNLGELV